MYHILIVDDEPLICKGLSRLLQESDMEISRIHTAYSAVEALDYLRTEEIDLLITDIQMDAMTGIDLMHQAKMIHPRTQTIVISAHDTFQYAQQAMRLGAKDYIVKPINNGQLLDSVRNVLLKLDKGAPPDLHYLTRLKEHFMMEEPQSERSEHLRRFVSRERPMSAALAARLPGPYYAVLKLQPDIGGGDQPDARTSRDGDAGLFRYAVLNIAHELLEQELSHVSAYAPNHGIILVIQWDEQAYGDTRHNKIEHLEVIGRTLLSAVRRYLQIDCFIGISQIMKGAAHIPDLHDQACKAISWNKPYREHFVFYYGDVHWGMYDGEPTAEDVVVHNNSIVEQVKRFIDDHYAEKGITLNEVAHKNHVSPNYLSFLFKKYTGCNLWEYVIKLRMEESRRLIATTDLRRYEIADRVGYESPEHFSKIFKKYFGVSPSELKK